MKNIILSGIWIFNITIILCTLFLLITEPKTSEYYMLDCQENVCSISTIEGYNDYTLLKVVNTNDNIDMWLKDNNYFILDIISNDCEWVNNNKKYIIKQLK